ncbi:MAG: ATP-binding protein [Pseudobacteriovorax sp.]|nr:ATP-binding protein [Pseudobacteriovorax sp.]
MLNEINLKFGIKDGSENLTLNPSNITVFVGPNNSGKSTVLRELHHFLTQGKGHPNHAIIERVKFEGTSKEDATTLVQNISVTPRENEVLRQGEILVGVDHNRHRVNEDQLIKAIQNPHSNLPNYCSRYMNLYTLLLNGHNRMQLVQPQGMGNLQGPPGNVLATLFSDNAKRKKVRDIVHEAFGKYFVLDPTDMGKIRIRLSKNEPVDEMQERGIHDDAVKFHANAMDISQASDGVKAFTGIITQIIAGNPSSILIDEPEAFLAPSLSYLLGRQMAIASSENHKRLFVSTHSSNFLMGCIQSGVPVTIVRLTYQKEIPSARVLPSDELLKLIRNPLLRSTGVLNGLFYGSVVVTEGDADRAFYDEINHRLISDPGKRGIPNCLFLNAQNKQTVHQIIRPLRKLGIPTAGIVDVDILKEGGTVWTNFLDCGGIPQVAHAGLGQIRASIKKMLEDSGKDMKKDGGIDILPDAEKPAAQDLFENLSSYGLGVVPCGELESWLKNLGVTGKAPGWLIKIFEKLGDNPDDGSYVKPGSEDVWLFIDQLADWLTDPKRKGMDSQEE